MELTIPGAQLVGFTLALVRTTAWVSVCPPFNSPAVPKRIRVGLATAISFPIAGLIGNETVDLAAGPFVLALLAQALAGLALGFTVLMLFSAIQSAGELIDLQVGFSLGAVLDPLSGSSAAPIGRLHQLLAVAILFGINGHVLVVRGYLRSVEAVPMGELNLEVLSQELVRMLATFVVAAVEIGLPVLAALFCTDLALGLLGKAAPQLNILVLGFAAKTFVALSLLGVTMVLLPESTQSLLGQALRAGGRAFGG
jgi:flagellar biosynthesis protein FliR